MKRKKFLLSCTTFAAAAGAFSVLCFGCNNAAPNGSGGGDTAVNTTGGKNASGDKTEIRLAYFPNVTHAPALVGVASGAFQKAVGDKATIVPRVFLNGPQEMEALLAGEVDVAYVGVSPAINAFVKSRGALHIVSGAASGGAVLVARQGAGITKPEDLVGKRIGTPQKGGTQDVAARYYVTQVLKQKLSDAGGTTQIVPADSPQLAALFQQKQLDAAWMQEPWGTRLIKEQNAVLVLDERETWPGKHYATTVVVARTAFLQAHPDLVAALVSAHAQLCKTIEADKKGANQTVGGEIKRLTSRALPPDVIAGSLGRIDFGVEPYKETLQTQADRAFALGFLGRAKPDLTGLVDDNALKAAAR